jgi:capsular exopolysaccharide synthesis family protein
VPARHLTDHIRVLYRRRWTAIVAWAAVFVPVAVITLKTTPLYEATAELEIIADDSRGPAAVSRVSDQSGSRQEDEFYRTQHRILESRALAWRAIASLGLNSPEAMVTLRRTADAESAFARAVGWIAWLMGAPERIPPPAPDETTAQSALIDAFRAGLMIVPVADTRLVQVTYRSKDPALAARAANAIALQYRQQGLRNRFLAAPETTLWMEQELDGQRQQVEASQRALQTYKETHDLAGVDDSQNHVVRRLTDLNQKWSAAKADRWEKEADYKVLQSLRDDPAGVDTLPQVSENPYVQSITAQIDAIKSEQQKRLQNADMNTRLAAAEANRRRAILNITRTIENNFQAARTLEASLDDALRALEEEAVALGRASIEYEVLKRYASSDRQLYENLLQRSKETGVAGEFLGSHVRVVDVAEIPRLPVIPHTARNLTAAAVGGLIFAFVLVFGVEYLDSRLKTPDEVKQHLGLAFLGLIPLSAGRTKASPLLGGDAPPGFGEAIRAIRTSVIFSSADDGVRSIVVTSTAPGEGKTVVSANLAVALAQAGQRTLIVDGDMRRPRVHDVFGCLQEPGLSNVLVKTARLQEAVVPTHVEGLDVLPAGNLPPNPAELLGSARYLELLEELGRTYPWIVIDAPPVLAVTDAAVAANRAAGVVFVVGAEMTPARNAAFAIEQLTAARARFIGAVLNKVNIRRHAFYYAPYYRKEYARVYEKTPSR